jgi:hypothetical protein
LEFRGGISNFAAAFQFVWRRFEFCGGISRCGISNSAAEFQILRRHFKFRGGVSNLAAAFQISLRHFKLLRRHFEFARRHFEFRGGISNFAAAFRAAAYIPVLGNHLKAMVCILICISICSLSYRSCGLPLKLCVELPPCR